MRRKVVIAAAALAVVGFLYWSQLPQRAPVHETALPERAQPAGSAEREALATPPPLALPEEGDDGAGTAPAEGSPEVTRAAAMPAVRPYPEFLPKEAIATLRLIERGGPYPYRQDDGVFQNRERRLPQQPRGYYREYTVKTPGSPDRGARRIVAGGRPPVEFFYTDDHYRSFRRFVLPSAAANGGDGSRR